MSNPATRRWGPAILLASVLWMAAAAASAQGEKLMPEDAVRFQVGTAEDVFIEGTAPDAALEEAVLPCSFAVYGASAPATVNTIQLKLEYDATTLEFVDWSADDFGNIDPAEVYWQGAIDVIVSTPGQLTINLDNDVQPTSSAYQEFLYLKFTPLCQPELTLTPVEIQFEFTESFIIDDVRYSDPGDPDRNGSVTVADYTGFLALNDFDPYDEEPATISLQGVVGLDATIEVPVVLSTNAEVDHLVFGVTFDETKLQPVGYEPGGDCHDWVWTYGVEPNVVDGMVPVLITNYPHETTGDEAACQVMNITFAVLGDWRGETTDLGFADQWTTLAHFGGIGDWCSLVDPEFELFGMSVEMEEYETALRTVVDDMIYPADGSTKTFTATIEATHNFHIGGDWGTGDEAGAPIRIDLDLAEDMILADLYRPDLLNPDPDNPLDDFWFNANAGGAKSLDWQVELYSIPKPELPNRRPPSDFEKLVQMELILQSVAQPATFDDYRVPFDYLCFLDGRTARFLDAPTGTLQTDCSDGLVFADQPHIDYAVGELACVTRTSTRPAYVTQEYWARSSFELADFAVRINKSGPHDIVAVSPAENVIVQDSGSDYVVFADGPGWVAGVNTEPRLLGTITYDAFSGTPAEQIAKSAGAGEKDIGPPVTWCWKWTAISFDAGSYLHGADGLDPFLFVSTGNVGTRWDCSVVVDPEPAPQLKDAQGLPSRFALTGNLPNPFNPQTLIRYEVPHTAHLTVEVLDVQGRRIATLVDGVQGPGRHEVPWNGCDRSGRRAASGVYFAVLTAEDFQQKTKMVLLK